VSDNRSRIRAALAAGAVPAVAGAAAMLRRTAARRLGGPVAGASADPHRWHVVTVNRDPGEVGNLDETPLGAVAGIEITTRPAPGDRGTEIAARLTETGDDDHDRLRELRTALRDTRQVLEVGWVLHPDRPGTTEGTPLNAPLREATAHGKGEGRL
jgi:hypothetical protein